MTQLQNMLTSIGATITSVLGPPLNFLMGMVNQIIEGFQWWGETLSFVTIPLQFMVGIITEGISVISSMIGYLMEFPAIAGIVGAALVAMNAKFLLTAISGVWAGVTSIMSIPFVGPVLAGIAAVGLISQIYKAISTAGSKKVGDAQIPGEGGGPIISSPRMGGIFEGKPQDDVLMGPGLATAGATAAGASAGSSAVVAAVQDLKATTQTGIDSRPSAKDIGKATGNKMEELGDM